MTETPGYVLEHEAMVELIAKVEAQVRAEIADERAEIAAAARRLTTVLISNAHLLQSPFTNAPELTPWTRSVKPALESLHAAIAAGRSQDNQNGDPR